MLFLPVKRVGWPKEPCLPAPKLLGVFRPLDSPAHLITPVTLYNYSQVWWPRVGFGYCPKGEYASRKSNVIFAAQKLSCASV